jgi:excisionase family DNA binding protein
MSKIPLSTPPDDLSTREVATWLGVTVRTVQLMVDRGDLHAWKTPGGHRRIDRASVEAWRSQPPVKGVEPPSTRLQPAPDTGPRGDSIGGQPSTSSSPRTLVLIEPDAVIQVQLQKLLSQTYPEHQLHLANDAVTGLALCSALRPELLVLNADLPGMDGETVVRGLGHHPYLKCLPVVLLVSQHGGARTHPELAHVHQLPLESLTRRMLPQLPIRQSGGNFHPLVLV